MNAISTTAVTGLDKIDQFSENKQNLFGGTSKAKLEVLNHIKESLLKKENGDVLDDNQIDSLEKSIRNFQDALLVMFIEITKSASSNFTLEFNENIWNNIARNMELVVVNKKSNIEAGRLSNATRNSPSSNMQDGMLCLNLAGSFIFTAKGGSQLTVKPGCWLVTNYHDHRSDQIINTISEEVEEEVILACIRKQSLTPAIQKYFSEFEIHVVFERIRQMFRCLQNFSDQFLYEFLSSVSKQMHSDKGSIVYQKGESVQEVHFILKGTYNVIDNSFTQNIVFFHYVYINNYQINSMYLLIYYYQKYKQQTENGDQEDLKAGEIFGENELIEGNSLIRASTIVCSSGLGETLTIDAELYHNWFFKNADLYQINKVNHKNNHGRNNIQQHGFTINSMPDKVDNLVIEQPLEQQSPNRLKRLLKDPRKQLQSDLSISMKQLQLTSSRSIGSTVIPIRVIEAQQYSNKNVQKSNVRDRIAMDQYSQLDKSVGDQSDDQQKMRQQLMMSKQNNEEKDETIGQDRKTLFYREKNTQLNKKQIETTNLHHQLKRHVAAAPNVVAASSLSASSEKCMQIGMKELAESSCGNLQSQINSSAICDNRFHVTGVNRIANGQHETITTTAVAVAENDRYEGKRIGNESKTMIKRFLNNSATEINYSNNNNNNINNNNNNSSCYWNANKTNNALPLINSQSSRMHGMYGIEVGECRESKRRNPLIKRNPNRALDILDQARFQKSSSQTNSSQPFSSNSGGNILSVLTIGSSNKSCEQLLLLPSESLVNPNSSSSSQSKSVNMNYNNLSLNNLNSNKSGSNSYSSHNKSASLLLGGAAGFVLNTIAGVNRSGRSSSGDPCTEFDQSELHRSNSQIVLKRLLGNQKKIEGGRAPAGQVIRQREAFESGGPIRVREKFFEENKNERTRMNGEIELSEINEAFNNIQGENEKVHAYQNSTVLNFDLNGNTASEQSLFSIVYKRVQAKQQQQQQQQQQMEQNKSHKYGGKIGNKQSLGLSYSMIFKQQKGFDEFSSSIKIGNCYIKSDLLSTSLDNLRRRSSASRSRSNSQLSSSQQQQQQQQQSSPSSLSSRRKQFSGEQNVIENKPKYLFSPHINYTTVQKQQQHVQVGQSLQQQQQLGSQSSAALQEGGNTMQQQMLERNGFQYFSQQQQQQHKQFMFSSVPLKADVKEVLARSPNNKLSYDGIRQMQQQQQMSKQLHQTAQQSIGRVNNRLLCFPSAAKAAVGLKSGGILEAPIVQQEAYCADDAGVCVPACSDKEGEAIELCLNNEGGKVEKQDSQMLIYKRSNMKKLSSVNPKQILFASTQVPQPFRQPNSQLLSNQVHFHQQSQLQQQYQQQQQP